MEGWWGDTNDTNGSRKEQTFPISNCGTKLLCKGLIERMIYLEDAHPVFGVRCDVRGESVATLQGCLRQETFANILEDDVGKVGCFHDTDTAARWGIHHLERGHCTGSAAHFICLWMKRSKRRRASGTFTFWRPTASFKSGQTWSSLSRVSRFFFLNFCSKLISQHENG